MNPLAIILIFISSVAHAGWNLVSKSKTPSATFFAVATLGAVILMAPAMIYFVPLLGYIPPLAWALLAFTGFLHAFYYISMGNAYRLNDMSLAYPVARSLPVLVVPIVTMSLSIGKPISALAIVGMGIILLGCLLAPLQKLELSLFRQYLRYSFIFVVTAALGISGYSIVDSVILAHITEHAQVFSSLSAAVFVISFESLGAMFFLWLYVFFSRRERINLRLIRKRSFKVTLFTGWIITMAYLLVLVAMQFAVNVSYIVAFRQVSILIGALLGVFILKEKATPFKVVGVALIFIGLVLTSVG